MARVEWNKPGERLYESGVSKAVLYMADSSGAFVDGVAWNGLVSVKEKRSDSPSVPYYIDGIKYIDLSSASDYSATLEAFTYPDEFLPYDGVGVVGNGMYLDSQVPESFGLSYKTNVGNDLLGTDYAYKLHILYNLTATPTDKNYSTITDSPSADTMSWGIAAGAPQILPGFRPSAHIIFDSRKINYHLLGDIENLLYGSSGAQPMLPPIATYVDLIANWHLYYVIDNGDDTFTVNTPYDGIININSSGRFQIDEINAIDQTAKQYTISDTP